MSSVKKAGHRSLSLVDVAELKKSQQLGQLQVVVLVQCLFSGSYWGIRVSQISSGRLMAGEINRGCLHDRPAEEANTNHEKPAGDNAESEQDIAQRNVQVVLGEPAVKWVEGTLVTGGLLMALFGMVVVDELRGNGSGIHVLEVQRSLGASLAWNGNRDLEMPERWGTS